MKRSGAIADEIWHEAITNSGLDSSKVHRFDAARAVTVGAGAQWWAPIESVHEPPVNLELSAEDAAAADATPLVEKHRVATAPIEGLEPRVAEAALAAKLRHELEHARQWEACGPEPFFLMQLAREVHRRKTGGIVYGAFLNQMPIEDDANAAASLFVRKRWPDCVDELRRHDAYGTLARVVLGPATPETLVVRMVGFLFTTQCPNGRATSTKSSPQPSVFAGVQSGRFPVPQARLRTAADESDRFSRAL